MTSFCRAGGLLPPSFYSDSRGRLSLHLENERLSTYLPKKALRGPGHSRKCPGDFFASFFFAWKKKILHTAEDESPYSFEYFRYVINF